MEIQWTDATSYSQHDGNKAPTAWEYKTGYVTIYLTCSHRYHPNKCVIVCREVGLDLAALKLPAPNSPTDADIRAAQHLAARVIKARLQKMINSLPA